MIEYQMDVKMEITKRRARTVYYPWATMPVGASFPMKSGISRKNAAVRACQGNTKYAPKRFRAGVSEIDAPGVYRIWRIA